MKPSLLFSDSVIDKSGKCHNHKPRPREREKMTEINECKIKKHIYAHEEEGKTQYETSRSKNHKDT